MLWTPVDLRKQLTYSLVMILCIETYTFRILPPRKFVKEGMVMYERGIRGEPLAAGCGIYALGLVDEIPMRNLKQ